LASWFARDAEHVAGADRAHHPPQHARGVRPAFDEISDEDHPALVVVRPDRASMIIADDRVASSASRVSSSAR
jgi:hypothetical protein